MAKTAQFGSISSGTMREQDLIPCFLDELAELAPKRARELRKEYRDVLKAMDEDEDNMPEDATYLLESLFDALDECAPAYGYFGAHPGDGADYGFWLSEEWQQEAADSDALIVNDSAEIPTGYNGEAFVINDHGNVTLYACSRGKRKEVWAVV